MINVIVKTSYKIFIFINNSRFSVEPICMKNSGTKNPNPNDDNLMGNSFLCPKNELIKRPAKNAPKTSSNSKRSIKEIKIKKILKLILTSCSLESDFGIRYVFSFGKGLGGVKR
jgi:hypothetical protein